jgi:hypothetical protein
MTPRRFPLPIRGVAAAAALAVMTAGGDVPMCVSVIAQATAPCSMHTEHAGSPEHHFAAATVHAAPSGDARCHEDGQSPGCGTGGNCPSGGSAAPISSVPAVGLAAPARKAPFASAAAHLSFVAPPLPPPPQA